jgi:uncharacterized protein (TIGR02099 family)
VLRRIARFVFKLIPLWSWRVFRYAMLGSLLLAGGLILGLRYWVLPNIDAYRGDLERAMTSATGQLITIGEVRADWRGLRPQFTFGKVTVYDQAGRPALAFDRVENSLSWSTLFFLEPRFHSFEIHAPHLAIRRARDGTVSVAGIELRKSDGGGGLADWVLRQPSLTIARASVSWLDEARQAPELRLEEVSLRLENDFYRHRIGLRATGPAGVVGALDVRADFSGGSVRELEQWEGQLYVRLEYADLGAYRQWVDLPIDIEHGTGALRMWVDVAGSRVTAVTADVRLAEMSARFAPELEPLALTALSGRVGWRAWRTGFEIHARELSAAALDGRSFRPVEFTFRSLDAQANKPARGELKASALDLGALANVAEHLPLDEGVRQTLARYAPRGSVAGLNAKWSGVWPPAQFEVRARFEHLGVAAVDAMPGLTNVSGSVEATEKRGALSLANRNMQLDLPRAFAEPLQFDSLSGQVAWTVNGGRYDIRFSGINFANPDMEGKLQGAYQTSGAGLGSADLSGTMLRADARRVAHYLPLRVGSATRDWLRESVLAGYSNDVKWRLKGNLSDFPFEREGQGVFEVMAKAHGGILDYAPGWPRLENIAADIRFSGKRMEVRSTSASILGAQLSRVQAVIPDLVHHYELLEVAGEAEAPTAEFMRFIGASPVGVKIDRFTEGMEAQGRGRLTLTLTLPLRELAKSRVAGSYQFIANRLRVDPGLPPLEQVDGRLDFTETSVQGQNIAAQLFGGPASITVGTQGGAVAVTASGRASVDALRRTVESPLLRALSGAADWRSTLQVRAKMADFVIESGLQGIASTLPAPFAKAANEVLPLRVERRLGGASQDVVLVNLGKTLSATIGRRREGQELVVERVGIGLGSEPPAAEGPGVWLRGSLPHVDLDRWRALFAEQPELGGNVPPVAGAEVKFATLDLFGRRFNDVSVDAQQTTDQWRARVAAREFSGEIGWRPQDKGQIAVRLQRLVLPAALERAEVRPGPEAPAQAGSEYPALDLIVDDFYYKDRSFGRLELNAVPDGRDWRIERLSLRSPDASLSADGRWQWQARVPRTQMKLRLEVADIGKFLARMRYPEGIRGGTATLTGSLSWNGPPQDMDYPTLAGDLVIDAARGQFARLDPGIGKLLSILSLQALPRRVTLDFKDVFSAGFAFDSIHGQVKILRGVASTESFRINGSSAKVAMSGDIDLARETQTLRVRVTPSVGDSVATVTALLGGPVVGIGVFLAQKLLNDPLGQLIAYDYSVTGTWSDPAVSKIAFDRTGPG